MKTQLLRRALLPLLAAVWLALTTFAQETADRKPGGKHDEIVLLSGGLMVGKVTAIAEEHVEFVHQGETLPYQVKKHTVHRIDFASGRSQVINRFARTFGIARQTLAGWLKQEGEKHPDLEPTLSDVIAQEDVLEYDELQHFVQKKAKSGGSGQ